MRYIYPVLTALGLLAIPISVQVVNSYESIVKICFLSIVMFCVCGIKTVTKMYKAEGNYTLISLIILCSAIAACAIGILIPNIVSISDGFFIVWIVASFLGGMIILLILQGINSIFNQLKK